MSRDKQIAEMAKDIRLNMQILPNPEEHPSHQMARLLVQDGYAKASDLAEEIFAEIEKILDRHSISYLKVGQICGEHYYDGVMQFDIAELKKKYTEEGK